MASQRFVYVLQSESRIEQHYVGRTADVALRLASHNAGESPHTVRNRPWRLMVCVAFAHEGRAVTFEKFLKSAAGDGFLRRHLL